MKISLILIFLITSLKNTITQKTKRTDNDNLWKNLNIDRVIDLSKSYVEETTTIVKEKSEQTLLLDVVPAKKSPFNDIKLYIIKLSKSILPKELITIEINVVITETLKPLPPVFSQHENQHLIWEGLKYSLSVYPTEKQKIHIKIDSKDVLSYSRYNENNSPNPILLKSHLIYNFHNTIEPLNKETIFVHYKYNEPIIIIKELEREMEISHWGNNIAVKNTYSITNAGTRLKENFSRIKWSQQLYYKTFQAVISSLKINLKAGTRDTYHIDEIGIVSTSEFVSNPKNTHLIIKPRYPVFGGWNYSCTVGWNLDLNKFLKKQNNGIYILKIPFIEGPINVHYKSISVNIILPEGSKILNVISRIPISKKEISVHKTYMDIIGRTSVKLFTENLVDKMSSEDIFIIYNYSTLENLRKPLTISIN
ncbi:unnamed protein product [Pneumocystis jirovecii]|uniref:Dolichyl-diphosphooligosaccharide--protein glycosyltransferase subunit 1 n=1 Tax=Pneumocystis jirovecii TaxID=42068 RepID=L0PEK7_PNEJI|nr:unnamed protein product [Pneumocystis jirovecii]